MTSFPFLFTFSTCSIFWNTSLACQSVISPFAGLRGTGGGGYQAIKKNDLKNFKKSDMLLTVNSKENTYAGKVTVSPGTTWFILENQEKKQVEFHLQCFAK